MKSRCDLQSWVCLSTIDPSGHSQPYHVTLNSWMRNGKKARMRAGHWQSPPSIGSLHRGTGRASCALPTQHWPVLNPCLPWLEAHHAHAHFKALGSFLYLLPNPGPPPQDLVTLFFLSLLPVAGLSFLILKTCLGPMAPSFLSRAASYLGCLYPFLSTTHHAPRS